MHAPWTEVRSAQVPPDREAEAASSRAALATALEVRRRMAAAQRPPHPAAEPVVIPDDLAADPAFRAALQEIVALLGGRAVLAPHAFRIEFDPVALD